MERDKREKKIEHREKLKPTVIEKMRGGIYRRRWVDKQINKILYYQSFVFSLYALEFVFAFGLSLLFTATNLINQ